MTILKIVFGLMGLSLVVVIHEIGHFLAAKWSGITVEAFSIGWGKVLFARRWKGTEFRLSLFPLGGYCKMQGDKALIEAWESHAKEVDSRPGDMYAAPFWKRIIVSLSGPVLNLVFAALIFAVIGLVGYKVFYYPPQVVMASEFTERTDYPANESGLQTGDRILTVNGREISRFDQLQAVVAMNPEKTLALGINRNGAERSLLITPELNLQSGAGYIGIYPWIEPVIRHVSEGSFLGTQGLMPGDRITAVNGVAVSHAVEISFLMEGAPLERLEVLRDGAAREIVLSQPELIADPGFQYEFLETRTPSMNIFHALGEGYRETSRTLTSSVQGLLLLFKGIDLQSAVSGPLRITYITGDLAFSGFQNGAAEGFLTFFRFIALISIALFVMNLLPIPVLDGGQILLFLAEGIFRTKPNPRIIYRYQLLGTVIVFGLIIFATMNDILFFSRN